MQGTPLSADEQRTVSALTKYWPFLREEDDKVGRRDLEKIVGDDPSDYAENNPELQQAARYPLDHPEITRLR